MKNTLESKSKNFNPRFMHMLISLTQVILLIGEELSLFLYHGAPRILETTVANGDPKLRGFGEIMKETRLTVEVRLTAASDTQAGIVHHKSSPPPPPPPQKKLRQKS